MPKGIGYGKPKKSTKNMKGNKKQLAKSGRPKKNVMGKLKLKSGKSKKK